MIGLPGGLKIYLYRGAANMRGSFDALSGLVRGAMEDDPLSGSLFVFCNRRRTLVKILYWDSGGLALWYKRLERGTFQMPAGQEGQTVPLTSAQLSMLLEGITPLHIEQRYRLGDGLSQTG